MLTVKIFNTGTKLPEQIKQKLFEPGFTTKKTGQGIGLWSVKKLVDKHNGNIDIVNEENGVRFIDFHEIIFLTREHRKTLIYTVNSKEPVQTNDPLSTILDRLNENMFFRSHKSYIVNLTYVEGLEKWGSKLHQVNMKHTDEKALVSNQVMQELEERLS